MERELTVKDMLVILLKQAKLIVVLTLAFALRVLAAAAFAVLIMLLLRFVRRRLDG